MSLVSISITVLAVGVLLWLVNISIPMSVKSNKALNVVVFICVVIWVLSVFGILNLKGIFQFPTLR